MRPKRIANMKVDWANSMEWFPHLNSILSQKPQGLEISLKTSGSIKRDMLDQIKQLEATRTEGILIWFTKNVGQGQN